ncbi:MAG: hypothetical protein ABI557_03815 [Aureliella sp.]
MGLGTYPKLRGLSLDMTERQFWDMAKEQDLNTQRSLDGDNPLSRP